MLGLSDATQTEGRRARVDALSSVKEVMLCGEPMEIALCVHHSPAAMRENVHRLWSVDGYGLR